MKFGGVMKKIFSIAIFLFLSIPAFCLDLFPDQKTGQAGLPGEYLSNFSASAISLGRGKTGMTSADDPAGVYFNPATLATTVTRKLSFLNSNLFYDTSYNYLGYAHPFSARFAAGISMIVLKANGAQETDQLGDATGRTFGETEKCYILSYARKLSGKIDWGVNLKFLNQNMLDNSAFGYGMDFGILWKNSILSSTWGFALQNAFQPKLKLSNEKETYPMNFRAGYCVNILRNLKLYQDFLYQNIMPDKDLFEGSAKASSYLDTGIEYSCIKNFVFRMGMDNKDISFGFGLKTRFFDFDYAVNSHYLGITHHFSLAFKFGLLPTEEEKRLAERQKTLRINETYNTALSFYNDNKFEKSKECAKKCLELDPENKKAKKILQKIELKERKFEARKLYEKAFQDFDSNKEKEAFEKVKRANELDPDIAKTLEEEYLDKAETSSRQKQYKESQKALIRVLQINKENKKASKMLKKIETILQIMEGK